jgi:hypothetical protein
VTKTRNAAEPFTKFEKIYGTVFAGWVVLTIWMWFGVTGLAVTGAVIGGIALLAGLVWLNTITGGAVSFMLLWWSLN